MVHKDYKDRIDQRVGAEDSIPVTSRITSVELAALQIFRTVEGGSMSQLIREGVMRVIDARIHDQDYMAQVQPAVEAERTARLQKTAQALASLELPE